MCNIISHDEELDCLYVECASCDNKRDAIYSCKELIQELVKRVYIENQFNPDEFEQILDDLCHCLNVKNIYGPIQIEKINQKTKI